MVLSKETGMSNVPPVVPPAPYYQGHFGPQQGRDLGGYFLPPCPLQPRVAPPCAEKPKEEKKPSVADDAAMKLVMGAFLALVVLFVGLSVAGLALYAMAKVTSAAANTWRENTRQEGTTVAPAQEAHQEAAKSAPRKAASQRPSRPRHGR